MSVKLLTEHHLEFLSLKGGCTGSSESILLEITCHGSFVKIYQQNHFIHLFTTMTMFEYKLQGQEASRL